MSLHQRWLAAKQEEEKAVADRRDLEDQMVKEFNIAKNMEGTKNFPTPDGFTIKIVGRMTRKVNAEKLQQLAAEHGLSDHLASLFKWTPTIVSDQWESADPSITEPLLNAITTTVNRPTFKIIEKE